jgi:hypothetical protein
MQRLYRVTPGLLRSIKRGFNYVRTEYFTRAMPEWRYDMKVEATVDELEAAFGNAHFTNSWEISWHYKGEDLNMRRPKRYDDEYEWYQTHVRVFEREDGLCEIELHEDLEPTEYPYLHLHPPTDGSQSNRRAFNDVARILENNSVEYEDIR